MFKWSKITSLAYLTLLELNIQEFPIPAKKIKCKGVMISSYQNYAKKTGLSRASGTKTISIFLLVLGRALDEQP